ncbi:hypothetical protein CH252_19025 [Rhodococcus sp. 06-1477-1B]|nr:hypothetical protein CH252_19025 [Rhodococcus sp. 06-1477-1B]
MNHFTALGLAFQALYSNVRILVLTPEYSVRETLDTLAHLPDNPKPNALADFLRPDRVNRANGAEEVIYPTGSRIQIRRYTHTASLHLASRADIVFIDTPVEYDLRQRQGENYRREWENNLGQYISPFTRLVRG